MDETVLAMHPTNTRPLLAGERAMHVACAIDVAPADALTVFAADKASFEGREQLELTVRARRTAVESVLAYQRRVPVFELKHCIEPARHPSGRPRVRVLVGGSVPSGAFDGTGLPSLCESSKQYTLGTILTPLREYVLHQDSAVGERTLWDLSQPVGAAVIFAHGSPDFAFELSGSWIRAGISAPILCTVGVAGESKACDALILELRERVSRTGFDGDQCPQVSVHGFDPASLMALGAMLDEHWGAGFVASADPEYPRRVALLFEGQLEANIGHSMYHLVAMVKKALPRARVAERQRIADVSVGALKYSYALDELLSAIEACGPEVDTSRLVQRFRKRLSRSNFVPDKEFSGTISVLITLGHCALAMDSVRAEIDAPGRTAESRRLLLRWLQRLGERSVAHK